MLYLSICAACSTHRTGSFLRGSEACWVIEKGQLAQVKQMEMQRVYVWGGVWRESNSRGFISSPVGGRERHWPDPTHGRASVQYFSLPSLVCFPLWQIVVSLFSSIYPPRSFHFLGPLNTTSSASALLYRLFPSTSNASHPPVIFLLLHLCHWHSRGSTDARRRGRWESGRHLG